MGLHFLMKRAIFFASDVQSAPASPLTLVPATLPLLLEATLTVTVGRRARLLGRSELPTAVAAERPAVRDVDRPVADLAECAAAADEDYFPAPLVVDAVVA